MAEKRTVVAVLNRKGGVGKTTVAANLAAVWAEKRPVVLVDADPQGSASAWLRPGGRLTVVHAPGGPELARAIDDSPGALVVVDGPPYDHDLNRVAFQRATFVLVPVTPSPLDIEAARPVLEACVTAKKRALVVLSLVDSRTVANRQMARATLARYGVPVATVELARRVAHVDAVAARESVTTYDPSSPAAAEVRALVAEIESVL